VKWVSMGGGKNRPHALRPSYLQLCRGCCLERCGDSGSGSGLRHKDLELNYPLTSTNYGGLGPVG
jgi:hypothetical protein